ISHLCSTLCPYTTLFRSFVPPNTGTWFVYGPSGILGAAGVIFFAYIGFDAISTAAQESKNPQRDLPIGILGRSGDGIEADVGEEIGRAHVGTPATSLPRM